jgi:PEP-CTERM motif
MSQKHLFAALAAAAALGASGSAMADAVSVNFESNPLGAIAGGADTRAPGNAAQFYTPDNAATFGEVRAGVGRGGSNGLVVGNRGNGNDGVIDNVKTGRLAQAAGESSVAPNNSFESSFWFRTASSSSVASFEFKTESWGSDRTTWLGFFTTGSGSLEAVASGLDASGNWVDTTLSTTLQFGAWYQVVTRILFVDGAAANDLVGYDILDENGNALGTTSGQTTWEEGQRQYGYNGGNVVAVDAVGFQARYAPTGDTVFVDDVSWRSFNANAVPEPATLALVLSAGLAAFAARRRGA